MAKEQPVHIVHLAYDEERRLRACDGQPLESVPDDQRAKYQLCEACRLAARRP